MLDNDVYDPLTALGARIATPEQNDFLRDNLRIIQGDYGNKFTSDLVRAVTLHDMEAAERVAKTICDDLKLTVVSPGFPGEVSWSVGKASGSSKVHTGSAAQAVVVGALYAREALERTKTHGIGSSSLYY